MRSSFLWIPLAAAIYACSAQSTPATATPRHVVGGTVSGLAGTGLVLRVNGGDDRAVTANGAFAFASPVPEGGSYTVSVKTQPTLPSQTCVVTGATGTVGSADVTSVLVTCTNANLYFAANDGTNGVQLWKTDGTGSGTRTVATPASLGSSPAGFTMWQGAIYYAAQGMSTTAALWKSDGTAAGTVLVKDVNVRVGGVAANEISDLGWFTEFRGALYFAAYDNLNGIELWKTDGTVPGTILVKDINPGYSDSSPWGFTVLNDRLYFCATDGVHGVELWKTDGTDAGTVMVKDVNPGAGDSCFPFREPMVFNGEIYFQATDGMHGNELWKTDGTAAGTVMVKDINPGSGDSLDVNSRWYGWKFVEYGGALYFLANDGADGAELWRTDGSAAGTVMVKDINPGSYGSAPQYLTVFSGALYFVATEPNYGAEIWKTDGTNAGTVRVTDVCPGGCSSNPLGLTALGGAIYFQAYDGVHGAELWKTDGTAVGTAMVQDIFPGVGGSGPVGFVAYNGALYFSASDGANVGQHGTELWSTDGTGPGTMMVKDIAPGSGSSAPAGLIVF